MLVHKLWDNFWHFSSHWCVSVSIWDPSKSLHLAAALLSFMHTQQDIHFHFFLQLNNLIKKAIMGTEKS